MSLSPANPNTGLFPQMSDEWIKYAGARMYNTLPGDAKAIGDFLQKNAATTPVLNKLVVGVDKTTSNFVILALDNY